MSLLRSARAKALLSLGVLVLALAGAELFVRLFRKVDYLTPGAVGRRAREWGDLIHRASSIPGLAYELVPDLDTQSRGMHVKTNSLGQRGSEPLPADTPGLLRIAAVGDSITFGFHLAQAEAWPALIEAALAGSPACAGRRVEVLNLGVSGYGTEDEVLAFEHEALALRPDVVVLEYCLNDPEVEPLQPLKRHFVEPRWWHHSTLLRWIASVIRNQRMKAHAGNDYFRYLHLETGDDWRSVVRAFARLRELCAPRSVPVIVVIFPMMDWEPWSSYERQDLHAQVAAEAQKHGFHVLDLLPAFSRVPQEELMIEKLDMHPNARGHRIVCDELVAYLSSHAELLARARQ